MELIKDYDCTIAYHPRKANVVTGKLRRKSPSKGNLALLRELREYKATLNARSVGNLIAQFPIKPMLEEEIVKLQPKGSRVEKVGRRSKV